MLAMSKKSKVAQLAQLRMDSCVVGDEEASAAAMMLAMRAGDLHFFAEILNGEGALDVNGEVADGDGEMATPLHHAVKAGRDEFVQVLLRHRDCDPNRTHGTGEDNNVIKE